MSVIVTSFSLLFDSLVEMGGVTPKYLRKQEDINGCLHRPCNFTCPLSAAMTRYFSSEKVGG
jgi:hypothetical protein